MVSKTIVENKTPKTKHGADRRQETVGAQGKGTSVRRHGLRRHISHWFCARQALADSIADRGYPLTPWLGPCMPA